MINDLLERGNKLELINDKEDAVHRYIEAYNIACEIKEKKILYMRSIL